MADIISLWANFIDGEYPDEILHQTDNTMTVRYCGQKNARNDKYVMNNKSFFFFKNKRNGIYTYLGKVIYSKFIEVEEQLHDGEHKKVNIFELVISKETPLTFRIKMDAYRHFGWKKIGQQHLSGIIKHTL